MLAKPLLPCLGLMYIYDFWVGTVIIIKCMLLVIKVLPLRCELKPLFLSCCSLLQETLTSLVSTGWFQEQIRE